MLFYCEILCFFNFSKEKLYFVKINFEIFSKDISAREKLSCPRKAYRFINFEAYEQLSGDLSTVVRTNGEPTFWQNCTKV